MSNGLLSAVRLPGNDRRTSVRYRCGVETVCRPFSDDVEDIDWSAHIRDISRGGLKLLAERRFESGTVLNIDTASVSTEAPTALVARVVHVSRDKTGRWNLGCCFAKELTARELVKFIVKAG
jgi:hypothetical protein